MPFYLRGKPRSFALDLIYFPLFGNGARHGTSLTPEFDLGNKLHLNSQGGKYFEYCFKTWVGLFIKSLVETFPT